MCDSIVTKYFMFTVGAGMLPWLLLSVMVPACAICIIYASQTWSAL